MVDLGWSPCRLVYLVRRAYYKHDLLISGRPFRRAGAFWVTDFGLLALIMNERIEIGQLLMLATRDFHRRLAAEIATAGVSEMSAAQGAVLSHIHVNGPSRMSSIAQANGVRAQSLLKVINELEARDYVRREEDAQDSRAKRIVMTGRGREHMQHLSDATERVWQQYAGQLGEARMQAIASSLRDMLLDADTDAASQARVSTQ